MGGQIFASALILAVLTGCSPVPETSAEPPALSGKRVVLGSGTERLPPVSVVVPDGFRVELGGGVDTQHAQIRGPGVRLASDYGRTGGTQTCGAIAGCTERSATVDGRPASWVRYPAAQTVEGASYTERLVFAVRALPTEDPSRGPVNHLLLNALCVTRAHCDLAEQIALTTRFGPVEGL